MPQERTVAHRITAPSNDDYSNELGLQIASMDSDVARRLQIPRTEKGVVVAAVKQGGIADRSGLKPGMLITSVERQPVSKIEDVVEAFDSGSSDQGILLLVKTPDGSRFLILKASP